MFHRSLFSFDQTNPPDARSNQFQGLRNDSRTGRSGVSSIDPKRHRKRSAAGSGRQSRVLRGELLAMKAVERFDPEGWKRPNGEWGWRFVAGARWSGVGNGSRVKNSPGFGFETELSGELEIERVSAGLLRGIEGAGRERRPRNGGESVVTSERKVVPSFQLRQDASPLRMRL
jgi:hypothetical protein